MSSDACGQHTRGLVTLTRSAADRVRARDQREVLICEPQLCSYVLPYLPAMWGVLKTYWETHADSPELINWHPPVYRMDPPEEILAALEGKQIDVLGLSCYTWNWRLQREVAKLVKETRPDCLIVAGGPHPDYKNERFFEENPFIDAVVVKNGEVPFNRILNRVLAFPEMTDFHAAGRPLDDIPGLVLPGRGGELTAPAESPADYNTSAYLSQREYYEQFLRDHPEGVVAAWETSRGCPFRCSYCDWGSSTMSKVRRFDMDRLNKEIEWFARSGVCVVFSVDSNFGMFKTDVDLTDQIVHAKEQHGHPQYFIYSNAKNVPDRTVEITRKVVGAGLETAHTLSIQHSSMDVLEATDRENISIEKQIRVVRALQEDGIPISVQIILGMPRDTPTLWRKTFTDLMEWGIHDGHTVTNYHLLPNAPAAAPEYREKWQIGTIDRFIYDGQGIRKDDPIDPLTFPRGDVIVSTSSFSRADWVTMNTESSCIRGLHNTGLTQSIARYLRCTHGVSYDEFYSDLLESFIPQWAPGKECVETLKSCYRRLLSDDMYLALIEIPGVKGSDLKVEPHRWVYAQICLHAEQFYDVLTAHLMDRHPEIDNLYSVCNYQRAIVVLPSYDKQVGGSVSIDHDWIEYFKRTESLIPTDPAPEPDTTHGQMLRISDADWDDRTGSGVYDWVVGSGGQSWERWFRCIATNRLSAQKCNFQRLELVPITQDAGVVIAD